MATALPSQAFTGVQRYLKQRRATGQVTSPQSERSAWQAYYDSLAANRNISSMIGARERQLDMEEERIDLAKDAQDSAEAAAKIRGVAELGSTAVLGGMLLKDTSLGAKIGLGGSTTAVPKTTATPGGGAAESLSGGAAATGGAAAAAYPGAGLGPAGTPGAAGMAAGPTAAAGITGMSAAGAAGVGLGAGFLGATVGEKVGGDKGAVLGGMAAGAGGGFAVGGPVGALIGGVIGGLSGAVKGK